MFDTARDLFGFASAFSASPSVGAAGVLARGGGQLGEAAAGVPRFNKKGPHVPKVTSPEDFNALNKTGSKKMPKTLKDVLIEKISAAKAQPKQRTMKDVLVEKIAAALKPQVKTAKAVLPFEVTSRDVAFFDHITKTAGLEQLGEMMTSKGMQGLAGAATAGAGLYAGASVLGNIYDKISDAVKREMAYSQMFEEFPNLKEIPREQVDKFWGVLSDYAPKLTINPLVAGQFIESMANYGMKGIDYNVAKELLGIQHIANQGSGQGDIMKMLGGMVGKTHENMLGAALDPKMSGGSGGGNFTLPGQ